MAQRSRRARTALSAAAAALAVLAFAPTPAVGAPTPEPEPARILHLTEPGTEVAGLAQRLADQGYDVVGRKGDEVLVVGDQATSDALAGQGVRTVAVDEVAPAAPGPAAAYPKPKRLAAKQYATFYGGYRTVASFHSFVSDVAQAYPEVVRRVEYGSSWRKHQDPSSGNTLEALCITANAAGGCQLRPDSAKPRFLLMAQIHAREVTTSEMAWRFVTQLVDGYRTDAEVTALLDGTEVWVVPQVNPDSIETVQNGLETLGTSSNSPAWQRKNANHTNNQTACAGPWSSNHSGIDLNRNWDSRWGGVGTSPNPCSQTYRGPKAASEPETSELAAFFERLFPDQRGPGENDPAPVTTRGAMITLHTYGNLVLFPWGHDPKVKTPNDAGLRSMGFRMSYYNGHTTGQPGEVLYNVSGAADDWTYDKLGIASFTYEIGPNSGECSGFHPAYSCQDRFWQLNSPGLLYAAKSARQPYATALGPTVSAVSVQRALGQWASVTAKADDNAYGSAGAGRPAAEAVVAAEVYLDKAPWAGGTAQALDIRGSGSTVDIGAVVSTRAVGGAQKLAYVRAKDAAGNWGPVTVGWLPLR